MLIIDTNALSKTFDQNNLDHHNYRPVLKFISSRGIFCIGGTTYGKELARLPKILEHIRVLKNAGQVKVFDGSLIDQHEERIKVAAPPPGCDDQHIIAMICVSKARVVATDDSRSDKYLKDRSLYVGLARRPSIYRRVIHSRLLDKLPKVISK